MKTIQIKNCIIGEGPTKIILPIVGTTREEILSQAATLIPLPKDMVEWRIDWYEKGTDSTCVISLCRELHRLLGDLPLLVTFRTLAEGGEKDLPVSDYMDLLEALACSGECDLIDCELFTAGMEMKNLVRIAHNNHVYVVASSHDFHKTPEKEEIISRLRKMQEMGADIPKIAVMPQNKNDVLTLLEATLIMSECYAEGPLITMSMGGLGSISRLSGECFGSAMTFGCAQRASAPGQVEASALQQVLQTIHNAL